MLCWALNNEIKKQVTSSWSLFIQLPNMFWFPLQGLSETFLIVRRNEQSIIKNLYWSSCTVPAVLVKIQWNLNVFYRFRKVLKYKILWKPIQSEPSSSTRTHGRTDIHDEANSRFSQFCERTWKRFEQEVACNTGTLAIVIFTPSTMNLFKLGLLKQHV